MTDLMPDLVWVDLETGGFDARRHDILEIAACRTAGPRGRVISHLRALVQPRTPGKPRATQEALELIGYSDDLWTDAHPLREAMTALAHLAECAVMAGHNIAFDRRFLTVASIRLEIPIPTLPSMSIDTMEMARPLKESGVVGSLSLDALCSHFEISNEGAHSAAIDVRRTIQLYRRLCAYASVGWPR
jgi:DNA polymerase-3 subunit epsilon